MMINAYIPYQKNAVQAFWKVANQFYNDLQLLTILKIQKVVRPKPYQPDRHAEPPLNRYIATYPSWFVRIYTHGIAWYHRYSSYSIIHADIASYCMFSSLKDEDENTLPRRTISQSQMKFSNNKLFCDYSYICQLTTHCKK